MNRLPTIDDDIKENIGKDVVVINNDKKTFVGKFIEDRGDAILLQLVNPANALVLIRYVDTDSIAPTLWV